MPSKRSVANFLCAFAAFSVILLNIALLTGQSFFEDAVKWNGQERVLSLFGTEFVFDENIPKMAKRLIDFNDVLFGEGFSDGVTENAACAADYVIDGLSVAYYLAGEAVGAE